MCLAVCGGVWKAVGVCVIVEKYPCELRCRQTMLETIAISIHHSVIISVTNSNKIRRLRRASPNRACGGDYVIHAPRTLHEWPNDQMLSAH